ncbi:MAG: hypothetical protein ACFFBS_10085 [Promethearchaeota archaeon]
MEIKKGETKISEYQFKRTGLIKTIVLTKQSLFVEYANKKFDSYPLGEVKAILIDRPLWSYWFLLMGIVFFVMGVVGLTEAKLVEGVFFLLLGGIGFLWWKGSTRLFIRLAGRNINHVIKKQDIKLIRDFLEVVRTTLAAYHEKSSK